MSVVDGRPQCPEHGDTMKSELFEYRSGLYKVLRKIAKIWKCQTKDCSKWCEEELWGFMWP